MENNNEKINTICIACGGRLFDFFVNKNNFNLYKCKNCNLIFVYPLPTDINSTYSEDYFSGAKKGFGYVDYDKDKAPMVSAFNHFLNIIEKFSAKKGKLLDIGAASGFFLKLAQKKEWNVSGVEISEFAASKAREQGLNVTTGTIEDLKISQSERFSVITMWDVIEHMSNPATAISKANEFLESGGIIAINTPDSGSLVAKVLGKRWHLIVPPEHLFLFDRKNMEDLLKKQGFEVLLTANIGKKFTLQYIFQVVANWLNFKLVKLIASFLNHNFLGGLSIPINLRDNLFIIAKKI